MFKILIVIVLVWLVLHNNACTHTRWEASGESGGTEDLSIVILAMSLGSKISSILFQTHLPKIFESQLHEKFCPTVFSDCLTNEFTQATRHIDVESLQMSFLYFCVISHFLFEKRKK